MSDTPTKPCPACKAPAGEPCHPGCESQPTTWTAPPDHLEATVQFWPADGTYSKQKITIHPGDVFTVDPTNGTFTRLHPQ